MKIKPQRWVKNLLVIPLLWSLFLVSIQIDAAQATPPIEPFTPENSRSAILNNYFQEDDGKYFTNDSHHARGTTQTRQAAGGPDEFGYTWKRVNVFDLTLEIYSSENDADWSNNTAASRVGAYLANIRYLPLIFH
jgi:hypothetical protein